MNRGRRGHQSGLGGLTPAEHLAHVYGTTFICKGRAQIHVVPKAAQNGEFSTPKSLSPYVSDPILAAQGDTVRS